MRRESTWRTKASIIYLILCLITHLSVPGGLVYADTSVPLATLWIGDMVFHINAIEVTQPQTEGSAIDPAQSIRIGYTFEMANCQGIQTATTPASIQLTLPEQLAIEDTALPIRATNKNTGAIHTIATCYFSTDTATGQTGATLVFDVDEVMVFESVSAGYFYIEARYEGKHTGSATQQQFEFSVARTIILKDVELIDDTGPDEGTQTPEEPVTPTEPDTSGDFTFVKSGLGYIDNELSIQWRIVINENNLAIGGSVEIGRAHV